MKSSVLLEEVEVDSVKGSAGKVSEVGGRG